MTLRVRIVSSYYQKRQSFRFASRERSKLIRNAPSKLKNCLISIKEYVVWRRIPVLINVLHPTIVHHNIIYNEF